MQASQRRQVIDSLSAEAVQRQIWFHGNRVTLYFDSDQYGNPNGWIYLVAQNGGLSEPRTVGIVTVPPVHVAMFVNQMTDLRNSERAGMGQLPRVYPSYRHLYPGGAMHRIQWNPKDAVFTWTPWRNMLLGPGLDLGPVFQPVGI